MGVIFSRYRRKKTPVEVLEGLEEEISSLEDTRHVTLQRQKKIVGHLIIYSVLIYVLAALVFYFCFFPASLQDRIFYMIPLLIFPIIVVLVKRLVTWYYRKSIIKNKDKLVDLRAKKKKILDEVMDKETYKVAKEILEKFAPDQLNKSQTSESSKERVTPKRESPVKTTGIVPSRGVAVIRSGSPSPSRSMIPTGAEKPLTFPVPYKPITNTNALPPTQRRLIRPVLAQNRSYMDRFIEALVGDGPINRYALICNNCATHNGMALKEEFEYIAFRCVYCGFPNPARKKKPAPPALAITDLQSQLSEQESEDDSTRGSSYGDKPSKDDVEQYEEPTYRNPFDEENDTAAEVVGNGVTEELIAPKEEPKEKKDE